MSNKSKAITLALLRYEHAAEKAKREARREAEFRAKMTRMTDAIQIACATNGLGDDTQTFVHWLDEKPRHVSFRDPAPLRTNWKY